MGLYDQVAVDERFGQVKLWENALLTYRKCDAVPLLDGHRDFDIAMREGGYVHVRGLHIISWDDSPSEFPCFDKWGNEWLDERQNVGEVGDALAEITGERGSYFLDSLG